MATDITLGRYFDAWKRNHQQSDDGLAEYLGVTVDQLAALAAEPVQVEPFQAEAATAASDTEALRPMPTFPMPWQIEPIAERHGANRQRLHNVVNGQF